MMHSRPKLAHKVDLHAALDHGGAEVLADFQTYVGREDVDYHVGSFENGVPGGAQSKYLSALLGELLCFLRRRVSGGDTDPRECLSVYGQEDGRNVCACLIELSHGKIQARTPAQTHQARPSLRG